ncbi:MAG: hypothetical protein CMJ83_19205 [Planctomycetes bacterium]|nr:hypothetical protein [Planctomycetota bacterium]
MKFVVGAMIAGLACLALYPVVFGADGGASDDIQDRGAAKTMGAPRRDEADSTDPLAEGANGSNPGAATPSGNGNPGPNPGTAAKPALPVFPKDQRPNIFPDDPVADVVFGLLRDVATGKGKTENRGDLEARLQLLLASENMGNKETREQASVTTISTMIRQAQAAGGNVVEKLDDFQLQAMKILSAEFARDLYRRLPIGSGRQHDGTLRSTVDFKAPEGYVKVSWDLLGGFEYEEGMVLPEKVRAYHGQKVAMAGYMMTLEEVEDIHEFLLVESLWSCCFGTPPEVHQVIVVTIAEDKGVEFTTAPVMILGPIDIGEEVEDGFVTSVYRISAKKVQEIN